MFFRDEKIGVQMREMIFLKLYSQEAVELSLGVFDSRVKFFVVRLCGRLQVFYGGGYNVVIFRSLNFIRVMGY